uniref:(northern house mosquito) hypothetical protein n=1 Tax=Culex pipiens TaxID=7175 RepID=A0A8D8AMA3_CULPI
MRVPPAALPGRAGELRAPPDQGGQCVPAARGQILPVRVVQQEQTKERLADERKRHAVLQDQADGTERQDGSGVVSPQTGPADGQVRPAAAAADEGLCHGSEHRQPGSPGRPGTASESGRDGPVPAAAR